MEEERKPFIIEILRNLVEADYNLCWNDEDTPKVCLAEWKSHYYKAKELFEKNFPDRPNTEFDELQSNCRQMYARLTGGSVMGTFTGKRKYWSLLLGVK